MTFNNIYDFFKNDTDLLRYFDPMSSAKNNEEASLEVYHKLIEFSKNRDCTFKRSEIGYIFYSENLLISFCVKPEYRDKEHLKEFGDFVKRNLGDHFECYLYNINERALNYLKRLGMKAKDSNDLITLLYI